MRAKPAISCISIIYGQVMLMMKKVKEYPDEKNGISYAYAITREEWEEIK